MAVSLKGQTILVTGASMGIGKAIAMHCAKAGAATVILFARSEDKLKDVAGEIQKATAGIKVLTRSVDVRSFAAVNAAVKSIVDELGDTSHIDVLVNNAGLALGAPKTFSDLAIDEIDQMVQTNISGVMYATHAVLNAGGMKKRSRGTILNITSVTGLEVPPFPGEAVYHTSKAAQEAFTNVLRTELQETNIKVLALRPGVVATNFHQQRVSYDKDQYDDFMSGFEPLHADQVAESAVWMLSQGESVIDKTWNERNNISNEKM